MASDFVALHDQFARAVRNPEAGVPAPLVAEPSKPPTKRFNVYRNNHYFSLIEALILQFPTIRKLLGEDKFVTLAKAYAHKHPPKTAMMIYYGEQMSSFLRTFTPTCEMPFLPEIARLEYAAREAYHAADDLTLDFHQIASMTPEDQAAVQLHLHPACRFFRSDYPVLSLWQSQQGEESSAFDPAAPGEEVLITRPGIDVLVEAMPEGSSCVFSVISEGNQLASALEIAMNRRADFPLGDFLAKAFAQGSFSGYH